MFSNITAALVRSLRNAGIRAGQAYPAEAIVRDGECFVRVRIESLKQRGAGFGDYLGLETDESGAQTELYGMRCDMQLALDIYASCSKAGAAEKCEAMVDDIILALAKSSGLNIVSLRCTGVDTDRDTGLFCCPCTAGAEVFMTLEAENETARFSDFILKGEIKE